MNLTGCCEIGQTCTSVKEKFAQEVPEACLAHWRPGTFKFDWCMSDIFFGNICMLEGMTSRTVQALMEILPQIAGMHSWTLGCQLLLDGISLSRPCQRAATANVWAWYMGTAAAAHPKGQHQDKTCRCGIENSMYPTDETCPDDQGSVLVCFTGVILTCTLQH